MENCKKSVLNPCASLPNMKFCAVMMQKKQQEKENIGRHNNFQSPKIVVVGGGEKSVLKSDTKLPKLFSELTLQADEELRNLMLIEENPFYYEAFLCHNSNHNKENDLTSVAAEIFRNRVSTEENENTNKNETMESDEEDEIRIKFDMDRKGFGDEKNDNNNSKGKALIFGSRLIDPVAWTLNLREKAMVVQFENPVKLFNENVTSSTPVTSTEKSCPRVLNYRQFTQKVDCFADDSDLASSLTVKQDDFNAILSQLIPCVGCRNSIEKLYSDLATTNHSALLPFIVENNLSISLHRSFLANRRALYKLLVVNGAKVKTVLENLAKCRKNKRCNLHSLDVHVPKSKTRWDDIWPLMTEDCADECCVVETEHLLEMLESYLQKHKFCTDCRTKIMKAYHLLTGEADKTKEPGYNANLYQGLRYCSTECHLHLRPCTAYLNMLMDRAEPELLGGFKERHAKTLEIAQGEVLTCIGLYIYDRLHRLSMAMKTLQNTFQLLYCSGVAALSTAFQKSVENKNGLLDDSFEKICAELQESAVKPKSKKSSKKSKSKVSSKEKKLETSELNFCRQCMKASSIGVKSQRSYHLSRSLSPIKREGPSVIVAASSRDAPRRSFDEIDDELSTAATDLNHRRPPTVNGDERFCSNKNCIFNAVDDQQKTSSEKSATSPHVGHASEDMGYLSSVTNPTDRKSTVSSDALSIESDRSEILDVLSESSPTISSSKRFEGIFSAGSLTEMLRLSNEAYSSCAKDDDGIDSLDEETDDSLAISKEDIEWFNRNRSVICQERQLLRAKLLEKFQNMQIRLSSSTAAASK